MFLLTRFRMLASRFRPPAVERTSKAVPPAQGLRSRTLDLNLLLTFSEGLLLTLALNGCGAHASSPITAMTQGSAVSAIDLSAPTQPQLLADGVNISVAKNAWSQWALQLDCSQLPAHPILRLPALGPGISLDAFQVLPAPVNLNDAQYIRQTGDRGDMPSVPRALLPLAMRGDGVDLSAMRDPAHPFNPALHPAHGPALIWIDLHATGQAPAGNRLGMCQLVDARGGESAGTVPIRLVVQDLTLPLEPHLHFATSLDWQTLAALNPGVFAQSAPRLLHRGDPRCLDAIRRLDAFIQIAHENKTDLFIPRLQPTVKWPLGKRPQVDWTDFDSLVSPWFTATAFTDHTPMGFWPLPTPDALVDFDLATRSQYWELAAEHFDQHLWLARSPVAVTNESDGPANGAESLLMSAEARQILSTHPRLGALLPMQDDQLQLVSSGNSAGIRPDCTSRLTTLAPGWVSPSPIQNWPDNALPPRHWIDASANLAGLTNEQGVRALAWLAFGRDASLVRFGSALPTMVASNQRCSADQMPLFYPGQWYGTDAPLATLSLKWIRQAEQDYEYLYLAGQRNDRSAAMKMCQLITRPVQLQPAQLMEPLFELLAGNTEPHACDEARQLLVNRLMRRSNAGPTDPVELQSVRWFSDRQRPALLATSVRWMWNLNPESQLNAIDTPPDAGNFIDAVVTADLYNPADATALSSMLQWTGADAAWEPADPVDVAPLARYQVRSIATTARFNLKSISADAPQAVELRFVDGFNGVSVPCKLMIPVAITRRRQQPINLDGSLDEWTETDAIHYDRPMVKMLDRPSLQSSEIQLADQPASIFSAWSNEHFYLAFRLSGVATADLRSTRNFVEYDHGRAWGEDLCEMLIQPIYTDDSTGPTLHIVAKPGGSWVEQQRGTDSNWQPFEASGLRYASGVDASIKVWRGELAIPWSAIQSQGHGRPALLRFNFIQHQNSTGQSASWAGPIDQSRDGKIAGLLLLKEP